MATNKTYDASSITWLKGLEGVRKKPAMYIGETDTVGVTHLFKEIIGNAIDEAVNGHGNVVGLDITGQTVTVFDNGRGIPTGKHPKHKNVDVLTILATELHAGGKLSATDTNYQSSTGTHGLGLSVVNALSANLTIWSINAASHTGVKKQSFEKGKPVTDVITVDFKDVPKCNGKPWMKQGTVVQYTWDKTVFDKGSKLDTKAVMSYIRDISFFNFQFNSKKKTPITFMCCVNGKYVEITRKSITSFVSFAIKRLGLKKEPTIIEGSTFGEYGATTDLIMCWSDMIDPHFYSAVNSLPTSQGGTHLKGALKAIEDAFKTYAGKKSEFRQQDIMAGVVGCINTRVASPRFDSQSKARLTTAETTDIVYKETLQVVTKWIKANKDIAKQIVDRAVAINKATNDSKLTRQLAAALNTKKGGKSLLPPNLVQCTAKNPEDRHLYIVEGDSAAGCFVGDTKIKMFDGSLYTFEQLTEMKDNDTLTGLITIGYNLKTKQFVETEITDAFVTKHTVDLVKVYLDDNSSFVCTPDHPWLVDEGSRYEAAENLLSEYTVNDELSSPKVIRVEKITLEAPVPVYDITVPATQNFQLVNGCIVHNTGRKASNRAYQEVLPLRGKILNVNKTDDAKMTGSSAIISLLQSIGYDPKNPQGKLRVGQIYVLSDPDPDGILLGTHRVITVDGENPTFIQLAKEFEEGKPTREIYCKDVYGNLTIGDALYPKILRYETKQMVIKTDDGSVFECSLDHKFALTHEHPDEVSYRGQKYVAAENLEAGDCLSGVSYADMLKVKTQGIQLLTVSSRKIISVEIQYIPSTPMYCITVPQTGNFYVMDKHGNGILSKNCLDAKSLIKCKINNVDQTKTIEELSIIWKQTQSPIEVQSTVFDPIKKISTNQFAKAYDIRPRISSLVEYRVVLQSGAEIKCDPSHKFCLTKFAGTIAEHNRQTNFYHVAVTQLKRGDLLFNPKTNKPDPVFFIESYALNTLTEYYCMTVPVYGNFASVSTNGQEILNSNCHINSLVLSVLWKTIPHAFEQEKINVIEAPLFVYSTPKQKIYGNTLAELMAKIGKGFDFKNVTRLKGYGEANPDELRTIAFDETTRKAIKVTAPMMQGSVNAIMGDDTAIRKELLGLD